jgi:murein DD-endopeptidase MepM/ murein hydrolase activator NlpD
MQKRHFCNRFNKPKLVCFSLLLFTFLICSFSNPAVLASSTDITLQEVKKNQDDLNSRIASLDREKNQLSSRRKKIEGKLSWLNDRSIEQKQLYEEKSQQLEEALKALSEANLEYINAEEKFLQNQEQFQKRMQSMFAYQPKSWLEMLLEGKNLQNISANIQFMALVADADQQLLDNLKAARDDSDLKKSRAIEQKEEMTEVVASISAQLNQIQSDSSVTQRTLENIEIKLSDAENAEDALNTEAQMIGQKIRELQKQLLEERAAATSIQPALAGRTESSAGSLINNVWIWPYPANLSVRSSFGWRIHPVYKTRRFHSGIDISGDYGSPVIAAQDGVVLIVRNPVEGRNTGGTGFGNYIVIAHENSISTLYGHLKSTSVQVGQQVRAGDKIGTCGSTGTSTGPHLQFDLMINGIATDPIPFIGS